MSIEKQIADLHAQRKNLEHLLGNQSNRVFSVLPEHCEYTFWQDRKERNIQLILRTSKPVFSFYLLFELISLPINYFSTIPAYRIHDTLMTFIAYSAGWLIFLVAYVLAKTPKWHQHYNAVMASVVCIGVSIIQIAVLSAHTLSMTWRGSLMIVFVYMFCYLCSGAKNKHIFMALLLASVMSYHGLFILKQSINIWILFNIMVLGNFVGFCLSSLMVSTERISFLQSLIMNIDQKTNQILHDHLLKLSHQDTLTLLGNRRGFEKILATAFTKAKTEHQALAALFIDIDYFKFYNDYYGHQQGDLALIQVAQTLKQHVAEQDIAIRYGGEEFVVLLVNTSKEAAILTAEKILHDIRKHQIEHVASKVGNFLTVSIGLTVYHGEEYIQQSDLLRIADIALYQAKNNGRDQMIFLLPELKQALKS